MAVRQAEERVRQAEEAARRAERAAREAEERGRHADEEARAASEERARQAERRAVSEAIQALRAMQSVTRAGVTYQEYGRRMLDAKIQVDSFLRGMAGGNPAVRSAIEEAMAFYVLASEVWEQKLQREIYAQVVTEILLRDRRLLRCQTYSRVLQQVTEEWRSFPDLSMEMIRIKFGVQASDIIQSAWSCASERISEAEQLVASR
jgi:hypothetical protein